VENLDHFRNSTQAEMSHMSGHSVPSSVDSSDETVRCVEFKTVDGVTFRGDLYLAKPQPGGTSMIIMTQGVNINSQEAIHY
jgi:hypothetical protein